MLNIKIKRIIRKIFFIIIFTYNEKFILNASEFRNNGPTKERLFESENAQTLMAKKFDQIAAMYAKEGISLLNSGNSNKASQKLKEAAKNYREAGYLYEQQTESCISNNSKAMLYLDAESAHKNAIKYYTSYLESIDILNGWRDIETMQTREDIAKEYYKAGLINQKQAKLLGREGNIIGATEKHVKAAKIFKYAGEMHKNLAEIFDDRNEARKKYENSEQAYKNAINCYKKKLTLLLNENNTEAAASICEEIAKTHEDLACCYKEKAIDTTNLHNPNREQQEYKQSAKELEKAALHYKKQVELLQNLGNEETETIQSIYQKIADIHSRAAYHHHTRAKLLKKIGNEAIEWLAKVNNKTSRAEVLGESAKQLELAAYYHKALLDLKDKDIERAILLCQISEKKLKEAAWDYEEQARLLEYIDNKKGAKEAYEKMKEASRNAEESSKKLKKLNNYLKNQKEQENRKIMKKFLQMIKEELDNRLKNQKEQENRDREESNNSTCKLI